MLRVSRLLKCGLKINSPTTDIINNSSNGKIIQSILNKNNTTPTTSSSSSNSSNLNFLSNTIIADPPKVDAKAIELGLKNDLIEASSPNVTESFLQNFSKVITKTNKQQQSQQQLPKSTTNRLLTVVVNGVENQVNVDENVSIKTFTSPSILYSCKLIEKIDDNSNKPNSKPTQYIAFDNDGNKIPNILLIKNLKFDKIIIKTKEYAIDTNSITVESILFRLCKEEKLGGKLNREELKKCIGLYEKELAITSPKTLYSLKTDPEAKYQLLNHFSEHVDSFEDEKMYNMDRDSLKVQDEEEEDREDTEEEEGMNMIDVVGGTTKTPADIGNNTKNSFDLVTEIASLSQPHKWYPQARKFKRNIILHVGPTNSGKTYRALNRLMEAESGVYCGPLRLLAHEIYDKMNNNNVSCSLMTGQLRITNPNASHSSCTVEMASTENMVEVAVIDEFQLISDISRGPAWTRAILGIPAVELHLCGDNTAVELVRKMCEITGDTLTINSYDRLSGLTIDDKTSSLSEVKKGDCIITFKKREVMKFKDQLEEKGFKCAVVYGSLPPITRVKQSKLFNDGKEVDILIATDAVGMGLNLNIHRIIFSTTDKFDGNELRPLYPSEVKQIAGRAGRFGTKYANGIVTCFDRKGLEKIRVDVSSPNINTERAGVFPSVQQIETFSKLASISGLPFSKMMEQFLEYTNLDDHYFLGNFEEFIKIAAEIDEFEMLVPHKYNFVLCPISSLKNQNTITFYKSYAKLYSKGEKVPLLFNFDTINKKEQQLLKIQQQSSYGGGNSYYSNQTNTEFLSFLEEFYNISDIYLWLSNYFPDNFYEPKKAIELSEFITNKISEILEKINIEKKEQKEKKKQRYNRRF